MQFHYTISSAKIRQLALGAIIAAAVFYGCDSDDGSASVKNVTIQFAAKVNGADFACDQTYENVGAENADGDLGTITPKDFRLFIHDLELLDGAGVGSEVALLQDGTYQDDNVALLDFEDASGSCDAGSTEATNTTIVGKVVEGDYTGIRFKLGVPFDLNHQDASSADAPLNDTTLFWSWAFGYKFARIDFTFSGGNATGDNQFNFHLGSTGCTADSSVDAPDSACSYPNVSEIELDGYSSGATVVIDLGAMLADTILSEDDTNGLTTPDASTPAVASNKTGCMGSNADPECKTIFNNLGLDFTFAGDSTEGERYSLTVDETYASEGQTAFSIE